jgi:hypothetical protein
VRVCGRVNVVRLEKVRASRATEEVFGPLLGRNRERTRMSVDQVDPAQPWEATEGADCGGRCAAAALLNQQRMPQRRESCRGERLGTELRQGIPTCR